MSGTNDTSGPTDRARFVQMISGGGSFGAGAVTVAEAVQNCQLAIPETEALLLDLPTPCTFARAAGRWLLRRQAGTP